MEEGYQITVDRLQELMQAAFPKMRHLKQCSEAKEDENVVVAGMNLGCDGGISVVRGEYPNEAAVVIEIEKLRQSMRERAMEMLASLDIE